MPVVLYIYIVAAIHMGWSQTWEPRVGRNFRVGTSTSWEINFIAAHMVTLLPVAAVFVCCKETNSKLRVLFALGIPFMFNMFAYASSRGAMLALGAVGVAATIIAKGRMRAYVFAAMIVCALLGLRLFNEEFTSRFFTISTYEEDGSALGRVYAWKAAGQLVSENPFGYGAEAFDGGLADPLMPLGFHTTHNMFFEILVAWGVVGVVLFFLPIFMSMYECLKIQRSYWIAGRIAQPRPVWESTGIFLAFVGILVASVFLNRVRYEMWWILMAYATCMKNTYLMGGIPHHFDEVDAPSELEDY
jgi:O-antigen ligase